MWIPGLEAGYPKPVAILRALQKSIETGELRVNDQLPPQRELAYALGVNLSTVARAMAEATKQGLIAGEVGRGTYVLPVSRASQLFEKPFAPPQLLDMSSIVPPEVDTDMLLDVLARGRTDALFGYPAPELLARARKAVLEWLDWRGLSLPQADVILTAGAHAGLQSLLSVLSQSGTTVLTEEYTFPGIKALASFSGVRLKGVPCDDQGLLPEPLEQVCRSTGARVLVAMPNLQNPTGAIMGPDRREAIVDVIRRTGLTLVEDDVYGSYVDLPPLMSQLEGEHIYLSSLSKSVAPALRFGFAVGRHPAIRVLAREVAVTSWFASPITLGTATDLIMSGKAAAAAEHQREIIAQRWKTVRQIFPEARATPSTHLWLRVEDSTDFCEAARIRQVSTISSHFFAVNREECSFVRCSITSTQPFDLEQGLYILRDLGARV